MSALIIAVAVIVFLVVIGLSDINIYYSFSHKENENTSKLMLKIWFLKFKIPVKKDNKETEDLKELKEKKSEFKIKYYFRLIDYLKTDFKKFLLYLKDKTVKIQKLDINIVFGFCDAAVTGIATGVINGTVYSALGFLHHNFNLKEFNVDVKPDFEHEAFEALIKGNIKIKIMYIFGTAFLVLKLLIKKIIAEKKGMI